MVTRASPVAPHETNRRDDTMIETNSEVAQDVVLRDDDRFQMPGLTTMRLRQTEKHFESPSVANHLENSLRENLREVQRA